MKTTGICPERIPHNMKSYLQELNMEMEEKKSSRMNQAFLPMACASVFTMIFLLWVIGGI